MKKITNMSSPKELASFICKLNSIYKKNYAEGSAVEVLYKEAFSLEPESELFFHDKKIYRKLRVSAINVFYNKNGKKLYLREERQVLKNGEVRQRVLDSSISEKLFLSEDFKSGAKRAFLEELNINLGEVDFEFDDRAYFEVCEDKISSRFPDIISSYEKRIYQCYISSRYYKPFYIEKTQKKDIYFSWIPIL